MPDITENDVYRSSTQFRHWSFTEEALASLRSTTNASATERVRVALKNLNAHKSKDDTNRSNGDDGNGQQQAPAKDVECLTVEEEQRLVGYYCLKTMQFADFFPLPTNVKATAVQYLKRFYLSNSPMTYHPKEIVPTAIFLATKTENCYTPLNAFASKYPKATPEGVIAPEFLLTQGLRFTFDVKHPERGLEGIYMELLAMADGNGQGGPDVDVPSVQLQESLRNLKPAKGGNKAQLSKDEVTKRIEKAKTRAKEFLTTSALLTDAYLLYTPSQILLAALLLADEPLTKSYLDSKFPSPSTFRAKLMTTLEICGELLKSSPSAAPGKEEISALTKIDKKLYLCRNPEKLDLIGISKAQKREGAEDGLDEKIIKKRKLERQQLEKDAEDVFGPALSARQ